MMKKFSALLLWSLSSVAFAELAPVIDNSSYPSGAPAVIPAQANTSVNNTYELMTRLDEAQNEIQQLNGKIEEQTNLIAELKKKQSIMYSDFDDRLQQMETKINSNKSNVATESSTPKEKEQEAEVPASKSVSPAATPSPPQSRRSSEKTHFPCGIHHNRAGSLIAHTRIHNIHAICDLSDNTKIMSDQDKSHVELFLHLADELQDL